MKAVQKGISKNINLIEVIDCGFQCHKAFHSRYSNRQVHFLPRPCHLIYISGNMR